MYEDKSESIIEIPANSWRSLKAHLAGRLGELFALAWLSEQKVPKDEIWGLRRGPEQGAVGPLHSPSVERSVFRELSYPAKLLLTIFSPPRPGSFYGLPKKIEENLRPLFSAWLPERGREREVGRLLLDFLKEHPGWPWWSIPPPRLIPSEEIFALDIPEIIRQSAQNAMLYIVRTPTSDFKAVPLILEAFHAGDFVMLKWNALHRYKIEPPEIKEPTIIVNTYAPRKTKCSWIIEVEPIMATRKVARKLKRLHKSIAKIRCLGNKIYIYGQIDEATLKEKLKQAQNETQVELKEFYTRHSRMLSTSALEEALGFVPPQGVEVWEGRLKGLEIIEVKTGTGELTTQQMQALHKIRIETEKLNKILGHSLEVEYKLLRVELKDFELPKQARISASRIE
jgi:hypothetical protein